MDREPIHYVPVSEQRYARVLQALEGYAHAPWRHPQWCAIADDIYGIASSTDQLGPGDTPIPMDVDALRDLAKWMQSHDGTVNAVQVAVRIASAVQRP